MLHDTFTHPETGENEIFFLNMTKEKFENLNITSKRMGTKAYDGNGNELTKENWLPVFIAKTEIDNIQDLKELRLSFQ